MNMETQILRPDPLKLSLAVAVPRAGGRGPEIVMPVPAEGVTIPAHLRDSEVLSNAAHRLHQKLHEEIEVHDQLEALASRWSAKTAAYRAAGNGEAALDAEQRVSEYESLANMLADAVPLVEVLDGAARRAREHQRREQ